MKKKTNRRPQTSKPAKSGNTPYMEGMQEIRRSNAAGPHRSAADFRRRPKHMKKGWGED